ncbi:MAG: hypothetical protein U7123_04270 [Potamolinea sp.]
MGKTTGTQGILLFFCAFRLLLSKTVTKIYESKTIDNYDAQQTPENIGDLCHCSGNHMQRRSLRDRR